LFVEQFFDFSARGWTVLYLALTFHTQQRCQQFNRTKSMGIFDFNKTSEKNIKTLFELDFENSPSAEFYEQGEPTEFEGQIVRTFSKSFIEEHEFECGLFDVIDVKTFEGLP